MPSKISWDSIRPWKGTIRKPPLDVGINWVSGWSHLVVDVLAAWGAARHLIGEINRYARVSVSTVAVSPIRPIRPYLRESFSISYCDDVNVKNVVSHSELFVCIKRAFLHFSRSSFLCTRAAIFPAMAGRDFSNQLRQWGHKFWYFTFVWGENCANSESLFYLFYTNNITNVLKSTSSF